MLPDHLDYQLELVDEESVDDVILPSSAPNLVLPVSYFQLL